MSENFTFTVSSPTYGTFTVTAPEKFRSEIERYSWRPAAGPKSRKLRLSVAAQVTDAQGKRRTIYLHRLVMDLAGCAPKAVDHIDRDTFNNSEDNLRDGSRCNPMNVGLRRTNTSGVTGIRRRSDSNRWEARIWLKNRFIYLGLFEDIQEAARVRNAKAKELHGEFAVLNYPTAKQAPGADGGKEGDHG